MSHSHPSQNSDADDVPWLRDMVDDDLQALFVEDERGLKHAVRHFIQAVQDDPEVETRLIDLLETALDEGNDDTSASVMTTIILGEARSLNAVPVLARALASDDDELLQDAASIALLRIGAPAVHCVMERLDDANVGQSRSLYSFLGQVGVIEDAALNQAVREFLRDRVEDERKKPRPESALEELFRSSALLGDRRQLPILKQILAEDYNGRNSGLLDVSEMLEENVAEIPFVATPPPWIERYGWLYEDEREQARVIRTRTGEVAISLFGGEDDDDVAGESLEDEELDRDAEE